VNPVQQTVLQGPGRTDGNSADGTPGDCLRACVASLFALPLGDVPHFAVSDTWWDDVQVWVDETSGGRLRIVCAHPDLPVYGPGVWWPEHVIASGPSPRGDYLHAVLVDAKTGVLAHDPHPSGDGLAGPPVDFLVVEVVE
jgi:hypothetical protein